MIIESEIHKTQSSLVTDMIGIDKTNLIERSPVPVLRHIHFIKGSRIPRIVKSERQSQVMTTVNTNTSRITPHHREVTSQGTHCTAHTNESCRTVQFFS